MLAQSLIRSTEPSNSQNRDRSLRASRVIACLGNCRSACLRSQYSQQPLGEHCTKYSGEGVLIKGKHTATRIPYKCVRPHFPAYHHRRSSTADTAIGIEPCDAKYIASAALGKPLRAIR
jgi:hypothetical protein